MVEEKRVDRGGEVDRIQQMLDVIEYRRSLDSALLEAYSSCLKSLKASALIGERNQILAVGDNFLEILGYSKEDKRSLIGTNFQLLVKGHPQEVYEYFRRFDSITRQEVGVRRGDGRKYRRVIVEGQVKKDFEVAYTNANNEGQVHKETVTVVYIDRASFFRRAPHGFKQFLKERKKSKPT